MDTAQINAMLQTAGVTTANGGINWANLTANIIFGCIGCAALMYGWKNKEPKPLVIGLGLSVYTFFISNTFLMYAIGIILTAVLYFWRD